MRRLGTLGREAGADGAEARSTFGGGEVNRWEIRVCLWVCVLLLGQVLQAAHANYKSRLSSYDRAVNEAMDMTLEVGSEWRSARRSYTWGELQAEVCRRLKVQRKEPWQR